MRTKRCLIGRVAAAALVVAAWLTLGAAAATATPPSPRPHHAHHPSHLVPVRGAAARTTAGTPRPARHGPALKVSGVPAALRSTLPSLPGPTSPDLGRVGQPSAAVPPAPAPAAVPPSPAPLSLVPDAVTRGQTPVSTGTPTGAQPAGAQAAATPGDVVIGDASSVLQAIGKSPLARVAHSYVVVLTLAGLVLLFLVVHRRFDRREPKLTSAPGMGHREYLEFA